MIYCFDTSSFINPWSKSYPIANFPTFWEKLDDMINAGDLIAPMEVFIEIEKQEDELYKWVKARKQLFKEVNNEVEVAMKDKVLSKFPNMINPQNTRESADPWVIAQAIVEGAIVVSEEEKSKKKRPKIPDVCKGLNVARIRIIDLITAKNWIFR